MEKEKKKKLCWKILFYVNSSPFIQKEMNKLEKQKENWTSAEFLKFPLG